jgi:nucleoid-associated protein YgaU
MELNPRIAALLVVAGFLGIFGGAWLFGVLDPVSTGVPPLEQAPTDRAADGSSAEGGEGSASANSETDEVVVPRFDVVRVEGDGSIVIAGRAAPNAQVEIMTGASAIGTAMADSFGHFAFVLDEPLKPGDYSIVLRATDERNVAAMSKETAILSIPDQPDGQVLALVEQPGEPSKLITVPSAAGSADEDTGQAQSTPKTGRLATSSGMERDVDGKASGSETVAAQSADGVGENEAAADPAVASSPEASSGEAVSSPDQAAGELVPSETGAADSEPQNGTEAVDAPTEKPAAPSAGTPSVAQAPDAPKIAVQAVEIDGKNIFVAGFAEPGHVVRVYANDIYLGDATASAAARFLVETIRELPVGDYIIRADLLQPGSAKVIARAAVPFERPAGEQVAAVAPDLMVTPSDPEGEETELGSEPAAKVVAVPAGADDGVKQGEAARASDVPEPAAAGTRPAPAKDDPEAIPGGSEVRGEVLAERGTVRPAGESAGQGSVHAGPEVAEPKAAVPSSRAEEPIPAEEPVAVPRQADSKPQPATGLAEADVARTSPSGEESGRVDDGAREVQEPGSGADPGGERAPVAIAAAETEPAQPEPEAKPAMEVTAPKLENVEGAVIIRRGDTLWQISRRVYGRGVRYSTIYLANQDQIEDPDLIWPGQIFRVPEETPEGERADLSKLKDQAVTVE